MFLSLACVKKNKRSNKMQIEKKNGCFPDLDKHLKERGRKLVSYKEGAEIYGIPSVSSVMLVEFWFQWKRFIIRYHWLKVDHMIEAI